MDHNNPETKVLAFLQNMWFPPNKIERWEKLTQSPRRHWYITAALFAGCKTGQRLKAADFPEWPNVIWEECSTHIGSVSSASNPADPHHMAAQINRFKPQLILAFGKPAAIGLSLLGLTNCEVMLGPHPAARQEVMTRLIEMAQAARKVYSNG